MKKDRFVRLEGNVLVLTVGKKVTKYLVEDIVPDPAIADPAFRLTKEDGTSYDVSFNKHGPTCECGDQHWRKDKRNELCKHIRALQAVGKIPLPDDPNETR